MAAQSCDSISTKANPRSDWKRVSRTNPKFWKSGTRSKVGEIAEPVEIARPGTSFWVVYGGQPSPQFPTALPAICIPADGF
ncbi:MAG: hypothetical protein Q9221_004945 [Calogaya cf. arnoldii]